MKILFTTPVLEHPAAGGPQLRIENSIKALCAFCEVHIISRNSKKDMGGDHAESFYRKLCKNFSYIAIDEKYTGNKFIRKARMLYKTLFRNNIEADIIIKYADRNEISIIWFGYGNISYPLIKIIKTKRPDIKVICDTDSVWSRLLLRELPFENDPIRYKKIEKEGKKKEKEEQEWVNLCDITTAVSEVDAEYYQSLAYGKDKIKIFSNVIDIMSYKIRPEKPEGFNNPCMYLAGTFWENSPMEKAARWVIEEILPQVKKEIKKVHLYIIGNGSERILSDINDTDITITGKLESVLPYLYNADVALVPLKFESGTRFKILEAGACGIPIVSTTLGAEGIPVTHEKNILIADDSNSFAQSVICMINDKKLARNLADQCKELVCQKYSVAYLSKEAEEIINSLGGT